MARVLIVDDHEEVATVFLEYLTLNGYEVERVETASEAIKSVLRNPPDAVLMDIIMPVIDGIIASLALRGVGFKGPIVGISGIGQVSADPTVMDRIGFFATLGKPVSGEILVSTIEQALKGESNGECDKVD